MSKRRIPAGRQIRGDYDIQHRLQSKPQAAFMRLFRERIGNPAAAADKIMPMPFSAARRTNSEEAAVFQSKMNPHCRTDAAFHIIGNRVINAAQIALVRIIALYSDVAVPMYISGFCLFPSR